VTDGQLKVSIALCRKPFRPTMQKLCSSRSVTVHHFMRLIGESSLVRPFSLWCETRQMAALTLHDRQGAFRSMYGLQ